MLCHLFPAFLPKDFISDIQDAKKNNKQTVSQNLDIFKKVLEC